MQERVLWRQQNQIGDTILMMELEPVISLGRSADPNHLLTSPEQLKGLGISVVHSGRGGEVTYHGPGQLVVYPIIGLCPPRQDLHRYLRDLEEVVLAVLAEFKVLGQRVEGRTGVWTSPVHKICSIGIRASRWVTSHGLALNLTQESLHGFAHINPCGFRDVVMVALDQVSPQGQTQGQIQRQEVEQTFMKHFYRVFGVT